MSSLVHFVLYGLMLVMPLTGWALVSLGDHPISCRVLPWPRLPGIHALMGNPTPKASRHALKHVHVYVMIWIVLLSLALHLDGALKHQFDGRPVLWRMTKLKTAVSANGGVIRLRVNLSPLQIQGPAGRQPLTLRCSAPGGVCRGALPLDCGIVWRRPRELEMSMRNFDELSEREVLALAIGNEEEDGRIYADFAEHLTEDYPDSAKVFEDMAAQEDEHRRKLLDLYTQRFGRHIPYINRRDVRGAPVPVSPRQVITKGVAAIRDQAQRMEADSSRFYRHAAARSTDTAARKLLGDLAEAERKHLLAAGEIEVKRLPVSRRAGEDENARRRFVLQIVQPGLVGLMDGSVSTLAPVFAAAFATHQPWNAFLVGMAASLGAGISMGFAEALADDGKLSGRGAPLLRGVVCGLMTTAGGIGHTLPFLIPDFWTATVVAGGVVFVELVLIAWIQFRFMQTPPISAAAKVMLGGALVLAAGILIGNG